MSLIIGCLRIQQSLLRKQAQTTCNCSACKNRRLSAAWVPPHSLQATYRPLYYRLSFFLKAFFALLNILFYVYFIGTDSHDSTPLWNWRHPFSNWMRIAFLRNSLWHERTCRSVLYITKTFCQQAGTIHELSLDDLFLPGYRESLFQYCKDYFKSNRCGYYSDDDYSWIGFNPDDLDAFLLTEKGLLLLFQNYVVSGYEDYPITLLIPYTKLSPIVNPDGLLSVDHLWTTGIQKRAISSDSSR